jgi:hypothetical protein
MEGQRQETQGKIGYRLPILDIFQGIHKDENCDGISHHIGHHAISPEAEEEQYAKRNVIGTAQQEAIKQ